MEARANGEVVYEIFVLRSPEFGSETYGQVVGSQLVVELQDGGVDLISTAYDKMELFSDELSLLVDAREVAALETGSFRKCAVRPNAKVAASLEDGCASWSTTLLIKIHTA